MVNNEKVLLLKALANAKRLHILFLLKANDLSVNSIVKQMNLTQANVSQHLMVLRHVNLVSKQKTGKQIIYKLCKEKLVSPWLN